MFTSIEIEREAVLVQPTTTPSFIQPPKLHVISGGRLRSGVQTVTGFIPAGVLVPHHFVIPYFDARTRKGYQRPPQEARINELVADLRKERVDLPTAVLLNIRNRAAVDALRGDELDLELLRSTALSSPFYVVDGQHRVLALLKLIQEYDPAYWSRFLLPFVCMLGADEEEEMDQFYIVNSKAKSVRTDLAYALLRQRAERDPAVMEQLLEKGRDWQVRAEELVEALAERGAVWRGLIRLPTMEKGETVMPSASMVTSLKPLLVSPFFGQLGREQQLSILDAFWRGIRDIFTEAFDKPGSYVLQKGMGVIVLHAVLVQALEIARTNGWSVTEPSTYSKVLDHAMGLLQGENNAGETVSGLDFWRVAPDGAAGSYSSSAGRRVLLAKIRQLLPEVQVQ